MMNKVIGGVLTNDKNIVQRYLPGRVVVHHGYGPYDTAEELKNKTVHELMDWADVTRYRKCLVADEIMFGGYVRFSQQDDTFTSYYSTKGYIKVFKIEYME